MAESPAMNTLSFNNSHHGKTLAKPLYMQRLESCLNIAPFMSYAQDILSHPLSSSDDSDSDMNTDLLAPGEKVVNGIVTSKCGRLILNFLTPTEQVLKLLFLFRFS